MHVSFYMFVLYLVKTGDAPERTLRHRLLSIRLVIEPKFRNFFKSLFNPLTLQPLSENSQINFLLPKALHLYNFFLFKCEHQCMAPDCRTIWSAPACHRRGNRPRGVDGCAPA